MSTCVCGWINMLLFYLSKADIVCGWVCVFLCVRFQERYTGFTGIQFSSLKICRSFHSSLFLPHVFKSIIYLCKYIMHTLKSILSENALIWSPAGLRLLCWSYCPWWLISLHIYLIFIVGCSVFLESSSWGLLGVWHRDVFFVKGMHLFVPSIWWHKYSGDHSQLNSWLGVFQATQGMWIQAVNLR